MSFNSLAGPSLEDYPFEVPPPGFVPVLRGDTITVDGNTTVDAANSLIQLDINSEGWLSYIGVTLGASIPWSLLRNGAGVRDLTRLTVSVGAPETPVRVHIRLMPGQKNQLEFVNNTGANVAVRFFLYGWYYPRRGS
ncbi:MAG: hypothetical protein KGO96_13760 [Elusimicrobia bacterium]|nr:hypothetical protein [Elusimicrobiota bacterium]MDE2236273.1 hypothetical protein [Elusimicrobiota bacterium]MDE2426961.1 hypothetical protein [Elusimicrobiota bacterium]